MAGVPVGGASYAPAKRSTVDSAKGLPEIIMLSGRPREEKPAGIDIEGSPVRLNAPV